MKEQSIDDILKLLKDSVAAEQVSEDKPKPEKKQKEISTEDLQQKLKNQYSTLLMQGNINSKMVTYL